MDSMCTLFLNARLVGLGLAFFEQVDSQSYATFQFNERNAGVAMQAELMVTPSRNNSQLVADCAITCTPSLFSSMNAAVVLGVQAISDVMPYFQDVLDSKRLGNKTYLKSSVVGSEFSFVTQASTTRMSMSGACACAIDSLLLLGP
jgi:hypothetical protein